jgi:hypothetical protein
MRADVDDARDVFEYKARPAPALLSDGQGVSDTLELLAYVCGKGR